MTIINKKEVGERIHNIRLSMTPDPPRKKMSSEAFGKLLDPPASKNVIRSWEKGIYLPQSDKLKQLAEIGNVSIEYLLYGKEISGYGERIKDIRENIVEVNLEVFGTLFTPSLSSSEVESWELENSLPNWEQIEKLTTLSGKSFKQIIFGIDPIYGESRTINTSINFEKTEKILESSTLTPHDFFEADFFFSYFDTFRKHQVNNKEKFELIHTITARLAWIAGDFPDSAYKYDDLTKSVKPYNNLEEEIETNIQEINKQLELMKQNLLDKYKTN